MKRRGLGVDSKTGVWVGEEVRGQEAARGVERCARMASPESNQNKSGQRLGALDARETGGGKGATAPGRMRRAGGAPQGGWGGASGVGKGAAVRRLRCGGKASRGAGSSSGAGWPCELKRKGGQEEERVKACAWAAAGHAGGGCTGYWRMESRVGVGWGWGWGWGWTQWQVSLVGGRRGAASRSPQGARECGAGLLGALVQKKGGVRGGGVRCVWGGLSRMNVAGSEDAPQECDP